MRILVFGASGATGRLFVEGALAAGHHVTAFVRDQAKLAVAHTSLRIHQGDVADAGRVDAAMPGHDVVVSTLGVGKPLSADPAVVRGVGHVITSMERHGLRRLLYQSFIGVTESRADAGFLIRHVARFPLRHEIADHEAKESLVRASGLDWTIVRPPKLTGGAATRTYRHGTDIAASSFFPTLARADVADFLLREIAQPTYVRQVARLLP